jgi:hypothetical protein
VASKKVDASVSYFLNRTLRVAPEVIAVSAQLDILRVQGHPREGATLLVTSGASARQCSMWRGLSVGFELVGVATHDVEVVVDRLGAAALDDLTATDHSARICGSPPRGIMYNGAYEAKQAPHVVFATDLNQSNVVAGRHRIGAGFVEFLPAILINQEQLDEYDDAPGAFIRKLRSGG